MTLACGCPSEGATIVNQDLHDAWHALVVEQGGPAGAVNMETLQKARGFGFVSIGETILDVRARKSGKRASGEQRRLAQ